MLQGLQNINKDVGIVSRDSWLWLGFSPHSVVTFHQVRLLLVRCRWPRLCLWGHDTHISRCSGLWRHLFARASVPFCFSTLQRCRQFNVIGLFWLKSARLPPAVLGPSILSMGVETGPAATQFGPTCVQTMPHLLEAHLRWAELFQMGCSRQIW